MTLTKLNKRIIKFIIKHNDEIKEINVKLLIRKYQIDPYFLINSLTFEYQNNYLICNRLLFTKLTPEIKELLFISETSSLSSSYVKNNVNDILEFFIQNVTEQKFLSLHSNNSKLKKKFTYYEFDKNNNIYIQRKINELIKYRVIEMIKIEKDKIYKLDPIESFYIKAEVIPITLILISLWSIVGYIIFK